MTERRRPSSWPSPHLVPRDLPAEAPSLDEHLIVQVSSHSSSNGQELTRQALKAAGNWLATGSLGAVVLSGMNVAVPLLIGAAVQDGLVDLKPGKLVLWLVLIALATAIRAWATTFRLHANTGGAMVEHDLRLRTLERTLDPAGMAGPGRSPGELLTITVSDARTVSRSMIAVTSVPGNIITLAGCLIAFGFMDWHLTLLVIVLIPPLILLTVKGVEPIKSRTKIERRAEARAAGVAADLTAGLRVIQGLSATGRASEHFHQVSQQGVQATVATRRARGIYAGAVNAGVGLFSACLTIAGVLLALQRTITPGDLVTVVALAQTIAPPLRALGVDTATMLSAAHASGDRICELVDAPPAREPGSRELPGTDMACSLETPDFDSSRIDQQDGRASLPSRSRIVLSHIGTPAITRPLDLEIPPGHIVGIVAPAAITSDLASLFDRTLIPDQGSLLVAGHPATDWTPDAYRSLLLAAPEDPTLFDGTARDNITLGRPISEDALMASLEASASISVIDALPKGLDSLVGEGGRRLSGGQRQRLALAQALAQASIAPDTGLVLINPTTSVDAVTETRIADGLRTIRAGKTTVVITSSPNLLIAADEVVWLGDHGKIRDHGPHTSLLGTDGYREMMA